MTEPATAPDVTADIPGTVTVPDGRRAYVRVALEYRATHPLEIRAQFSDAATREQVSPVGEERGWYLDRATLAQGCGGSDLAGAADVRAASVAGNLLLHLTGQPTSLGFDRCVVRLPLASVVAFLETTYRLVPAGAECVWPGMDSELAKLIDNDGRV